MIIAPAVLAGLAAGAAVFVGTLVAVYLLLRGGGSFDRMAREAAGLPTAVGEQKPLLYDELLDKARSLALRPAPLPSPLQGEVVRVREQVDADLDALFRISNGEPRWVCVAMGRLSKHLNLTVWTQVWCLRRLWLRRRRTHLAVPALRSLPVAGRVPGRVREREHGRSPLDAGTFCRRSSRH